MEETMSGGGRQGSFFRLASAALLNTPLITPMVYTFEKLTQQVYKK